MSFTLKRRWRKTKEWIGITKIISSIVLSLLGLLLFASILLSNRHAANRRSRQYPPELNKFSILYEVEEGKEFNDTISSSSNDSDNTIQWKFCTVQNTYRGYSGAGYLVLNGYDKSFTTTGSIQQEHKSNNNIPWISLNLNVPPGEYEIMIRYASYTKDNTPRPINVKVDDTSVGTFAMESTTMDWSLWNIESMNVILNKRSPSDDSTSTTQINNISNYKLRFQFYVGGDVNSTNNNSTDTLSRSSISSISNSATNVFFPGHHSENIVNGPSIDWIYIQSKSYDDTTNNDNRKDHPETIVLEPDQHLSNGEFFSSPSGLYSVGLTEIDGDLVLLKHQHHTNMNDNNNNNDDDYNSEVEIIWQTGITGGHRCYMQPGGNLVLRDNDRNVKWNSYTSNNPESRLLVDDGGRIAIVHGNTDIWINGIPRGQHTNDNDNHPNLPFPIRGIFYYPWYPSTWTVNGKIARFEPKLGFYSSSDPVVAKTHIDALEYANIDLSIASWWGPDTQLDRARITLLMDETIRQDSNVKWTVYYEDEIRNDPNPNQIRQHLNYLEKWFTWHDAWAYIDDRPIIFVYNEGGCDVAERWMEATSQATTTTTRRRSKWYVVLKVFTGFRKCPVQPDSWHQYGPGTAVIDLNEDSYSISPGFWRADIDQPRLPRVGQDVWRQNVLDMVNSNAPWQLITTFNEAGEGTMIEASDHWSSDSGYGFYLDALHDIS